LKGPGEEIRAVMIRTQSHGIDETGSRQAVEGGAVPEVVGMNVIGGVVNLNLFVEVSRAGMEGEKDRPAGAKDFFRIADHQSGGAILILTQGGVDWRDDGDAVYVGSGVPLDA